MATRSPKTDSTRNPRHITEAHPNPHGEQEVAEMPLQTDHGAATKENVAQNTSTRDNRLNPVVSGPLEDPTTDSMFNVADRQTKEIEQSTGKDDSRRSISTRRTPKNRKTA